MDVIDPIKASPLGGLAFDMTRRVLKRHGHALIKVSKVPMFQELAGVARSKFARVKRRKASRLQGSGTEMYLLAMDFRLV